MRLRVATFNCENLLSRAKILNFDDNDDARDPLNKMAKLDAILAKPKYSKADKEKILELMEELRQFIDLKEMRGKLISRHKVNDKYQEYVKPNGRLDWVGGIAVKRNDLPTLAQENTAKVIEALDADVQCVVEVEDRPTLEKFGVGTLKSAFPYNIVIDGNDARGIDVGLLTKHEFGRIRTHVFDAPASGKGRIFSRDCLEAEVLLPGGKSLFLLVNHFKSQGYGSKVSNDARRKAQADRVLEILEAGYKPSDFVVAAGDFNDTPDGAPLDSLLHQSGYVDVLEKKFQDPKDRWTYKDKKQIDYILVSPKLAAALVDAGVERRGMLNASKLTKGAVQPFPTVTSDSNDASDHAGVWAEFQV